LEPFRYHFNPAPDDRRIVFDPQRYHLCSSAHPIASTYVQIGLLLKACQRGLMGQPKLTYLPAFFSSACFAVNFASISLCNSFVRC